MHGGDQSDRTPLWLPALNKGDVLVFITEDFTGVGFEPFVEDAAVDASEVRRVFKVFFGIGHEFGGLPEEAAFDF